MDIGDKSWGVTVCQKYFEKQSLNSGGSSKLQFGPENTLHVGDQFLSAGANDFRARSVGTTAWIASPEETVYVYVYVFYPPLPSSGQPSWQRSTFHALSVPSYLFSSHPYWVFHGMPPGLAALPPVANNASQ